MEQWNKQEEKRMVSLREIAWILYCNKEYERDINTLRVYGTRLTVEQKIELIEMLEKEDRYDDDVDRRYPTDSFTNYYRECRNKLKEMFRVLIGCSYSEAIQKEGRDYKFDLYSDEPFIELLIYIFPSDEGRKIRKRKFNELDSEVVEWIRFGMEILTSSENFLLDKEEVMGKLYNDFRNLPEYVNLKEAFEDLKVSLDIRIFNKDISKKYAKAYEIIAQQLKLFEEKVELIWDNYTKCKK